MDIQGLALNTIWMNVSAVIIAKITKMDMANVVLTAKLGMAARHMDLNAAKPFGFPKDTSYDPPLHPDLHQPMAGAVHHWPWLRSGACGACCDG